MYLKFQFLYNPLYRLTVDCKSKKVTHLCPKAAIPVIFVFFLNGKNDLFLLIRHFGVHELHSFAQRVRRDGLFRSNMTATS